MSARAKGRGGASAERPAAVAARAERERTGQSPVRAEATGTAVAGPAGMSPPRAGELQPVIGNAAVARAVQRARDTHDADCGHGEDTAPRSLVPEVLRRPGRPLAEPLRAEMEGRLGADFSDVRLHTGATAQRSATEIGARAYTSGAHVVIGPGGADKHT
ncbi:eCIS core domain-containing protein, partial [Streptomyces sp. NPDC004285]